jgi:hypothetical protein
MTTVSIPYPIKSLHTRLLYPFFFDPNQRQAATNSLTQLQFADKPVGQTLTDLHQQEHRQPDKQGVLEDFYHQDLFEPVTQFLFAQDHEATALDEEREEGSRPKQNPANYLKLNPQLANTWFGNGVSVTHKQECFVAKLLADPGIEVFLSPQGVGVLSIALTYLL